ncbi:MAG TPA: hypothetical protein VGJ55_05775 [Pyrinomonadaceae bacterium]|jgi:hypothetical protein
MPLTGYSRSPLLVKGAFIHYAEPMLDPDPKLIIFQYNPEMMTRTINPWKPQERVVYEKKDGTDKPGVKPLNELTQPFDPDETFSLTLELDAADALEEPLTHLVAITAGIADRLYALEMLCYPPASDQVSGVLNVPENASVRREDASTSPGNTDAIPRREVPIVLFSWGPARIVPVRITTFSVEEQQYSASLYPVRAKVSIGLTVLNEEHLNNIAGESSRTKVVELAKACYRFTQGQKQSLAEQQPPRTFEPIGRLPI